MRTEEISEMAVWNSQGGWSYLSPSKFMSLTKAKKSCKSLLIFTEVYEDGKFVCTKRYYSEGTLNNDMVEK